MRHSMHAEPRVLPSEPSAGLLYTGLHTAALLAPSVLVAGLPFLLLTVCLPATRASHLPSRRSGGAAPRACPTPLFGQLPSSPAAAPASATLFLTGAAETGSRPSPCLPGLARTWTACASTRACRST